MMNLIHNIESSCLVVIAGISLFFIPSLGECQVVDLTRGATRIDGKSVTLKAGDLEAVIVGNDKLDGHGGGYNGISRLVHKSQPRPLFIPFYSGINFEHVFDGQDAGFAPRGGKLSLWRHGAQSAGIYCPASESPWGLESMTQFTLIEPCGIDIEFTAVPRLAKFASDYIGMFWGILHQRPARPFDLLPGPRQGRHEVTRPMDQRALARA